MVTMPTAKNTDETVEAPTQAEPPAPAQVCVNCGAPATQKSRSESVDVVLYCDNHARLSGEGVEPI